MECTYQQGGRGILKQFTVLAALVSVSTNGVPTHSGTKDLHNDFFAVNSAGPDTKREGVIIEQVAANTSLPLTNTLSVPCVYTNSLSANKVATSCSSQSQCTKYYLKYAITNPPTAQRVTSIV
ncbi:hypothetical protein OXYTRIMIC_001 [Oxytricha trifallax]|uniref:Uncharacterized protein n=1 Tax=Oxytricha trifallax TaxID=1172189 RepID=A0A073HZB3_9SPIT|nr:hypothetical protein OXYTRIMIC_001 [Oxytricha trifallax]